MAHRSIRKFTEKPVDEALLEILVNAGQASASSSFLQGVTVIRITNPIKRQQFVTLTNNQSSIAAAPEFLVFCADLSRSIRWCKMHGGVPTEGFTEQFIISTVNAALYAQNVVIAAESAGLGICYIGAVRNDPAQVTALLNLPKNVYPVFGLCLGYPDQNPEPKPRLPISVVLKENSYDTNEEDAQIKDYDEVVRAYYAMRSGNLKSKSWSEQMTGLLEKESRPHMRTYLTQQGFEMK